MYIMCVCVCICINTIHQPGCCDGGPAEPVVLHIERQGSASDQAHEACRCEVDSNCMSCMRQHHNGMRGALHMVLCS